MKKKFLVFLSAITLLSVAFNSTACSKDSDNDDNSELTDSKSKGKADGAKFAEAYNKVKANGLNLTGVATSLVDGSASSLLSSGATYRSSEDKAYKAAFLAEATGATSLAESKVTEILGADNLGALETILKALGGGN
ncbi:MAG: hypothetical protein MJZ24_08210 [Paludibacteraceae bacterium]|nr:hypothetical protein [Candidatus Physcocola equi]MCQ2234701.1 hypothetical protein [Paludibacteraceae bacterium]